MSTFRKKTFISPEALCALIMLVSLALGLTADYFVKCAGVRDSVLRLHILASSDEPEDQNVKLLVRDALLSEGAELFDGSVTADEAYSRLSPELPRLEKTAERVLAENGFSYGAKAMIVNEFFDTRQYGDVTLPAGKYTALKIVLGQGKGHNWWCVMFPPLCLPAATSENEEVCAVFSEDGADVVKAEDGFKVRFRIVEIVENIIESIKSGQRG